MTDTSAPAASTPAPEQKAPLGVGTIIADSFSLLFSNFVPIMITSFPPIAIGFWGIVTYSEQILNSIETNWAWLVLAAVGALMIYGMIVALVTQLAYDAKLGRDMEYARYYRNTLTTLPQNICLSVVSLVLITLAAILFLLPGLWVASVLYVVIPALIIERIGFGSFSRSVALTKGYRWPILGVLILIGICGNIIDTASEFMSGILFEQFENLGLIATSLTLAFGYSLSFGLASIATALVYARLREIKEGVGIEEIVSVFE